MMLPVFFFRGLIPPVPGSWCMRCQALTPGLPSRRGRYNLRLFEESITFHGPKFTYNIPYSQIQRLFLLEKADQSSVYFAVCWLCGPFPPFGVAACMETAARNTPPHSPPARIARVLSAAHG